MFISKRKYQRDIQELRSEICALSISINKKIKELRNDESDVLFGFSADIDGLIAKTADFEELSEAERKERELELKTSEGLRNIFKY